MFFDPKIYIINSDGTSDTTAAVQAAIDAAERNGGGRVILKNGIFICGTLYIKSNVSLEIADTAVLRASDNISLYKSDTHYNRYRNEPELDRCFIYAKDTENIEICGGGTIDGSAEAFPNAGSIYRPMMIRFLRCRNVRLHDVRLYNSASWTTAFLDSENIFVSNIDIKNNRNYNGDGLDFDSCSHVFVNGCSICGTDDNLCLQSSGLPVRDVHISNCRFTSLCAAVRIGLKSIGTISDVYISHCEMRNVWREGIKIECTEGGSISNINVCDIDMKNVTRPVFILLNNRFEPSGLGSSRELEHMPEIGVLSDILISDICAEDDEEMANTHRRFNDDIMGSPRFAGFRVDAEMRHPIRNLTLMNISYKFIGGVAAEDIPDDYPEVINKLETPTALSSENYYPDWSRAAFMDIRNVENLTMQNISCAFIHPDERAGFIIENCTQSPVSDKIKNKF